MSDTRNNAVLDEQIRVMLIELATTAPAPDDLEDRLLTGLDRPVAIRSHRPSRRVAAVLLAAALVAAAAVGIVVTRGRHVPTPPATTTYSDLPLLLGFRVPPSDAVRMIGAGSAVVGGAVSQDVKVTTGRGVYDIVVHARGSAPWRTLSASHRVAVRGHVGFYGCVAGTGSSCQHGLIWRYAAQGFAEVQLVTGFDSAAEMLRCARALRFTHREPMRSAFTVPAPAGTHLVQFYSVYRGVPGLVDGPQTQAGFASNTPGQPLLAVVVQHGQSSDSPFTGEQVTVAGRPGLWNASAGRLAVSLPGTFWLTVTGGDGTLASARRIAGTVTVAPRPADATGWFDARDAFR